VINRDKMAEDDLERNSSYIDMPKCRRGKTGEAGIWVYDYRTRQCHDKDDYLKNLYQKPVDIEEKFVDNSRVVEDVM
jgi:hypothetical protein